MALRDDQKNRVQEATDLVRLIGEQVSLRKKGAEFIGLCPFHDDKNPSMFVSPAKQIYKCFSCGAGGDAFSFVMNYHKMTFPEALRHLADRAGIALEPLHRDRGGQDDHSPNERQLIADANAHAVAFFRHHLKQSDTARQYVDQRAIGPAMVEAFQLGYGPDAWDSLAQAIQAKRWDRRGFELAGLISPRKTGDGFYDRLRHRLIFPIFDAIGRPIAFGGRKLREEDEPKYLNSPETALFNKSATLYGLHLAKKAIIASKTAVIVEGYTDVIACHQALSGGGGGGSGNVVATLGTALTREHVAQLRRFAEKVVLIFDGDAAGEKAADRALELFLTGDVDVAIAVLPGGVDPADLMAQEDGVDQWHAAMAAAQDALDYQFQRVRQQLQAADTVTGRQHVAENYLQQLGQLGVSRMATLRRALIVQRLGELLHMGEAAVSDALRRAQPRPKPVVTDAPAEPVDEQNSLPGAAVDANNPAIGVASGEPWHKLKAIDLAQKQVMGCLLRRNDLFEHVLGDGRTLDEAIAPSEMVTAAGVRLYQRMHDRLAEGQPLTLAGLLADLAAEDEQELANLATEADGALDRVAGEDEERLKQVLSAAAEAVVAYHREKAYQATRAGLANIQADAPGADPVQLARQLVADRRENPSPVRIARF